MIVMIVSWLAARHTHVGKWAIEVGKRGIEVDVDVLVADQLGSYVNEL